LRPFTLPHSPAEGYSYSSEISTRWFAGKMPLRVFGRESLEEQDWKRAFRGRRPEALAERGSRSCPAGGGFLGGPVRC
jgi:hypothetical protein